jgi:hypothetical protein
VPVVRRFVVRPSGLQVAIRPCSIPKRAGIRRDSAIVAGFVILHVGGRFVGQSFLLALEGPDRWQPFASSLAAPGRLDQIRNDRRSMSASGSPASLILAFPYFFSSTCTCSSPRSTSFSSHAVRRWAPGPLELRRSLHQAIRLARLEHLSWTGLVGAYACIMCNRCGDACPAYTTGKVLSRRR